MLTLGPRWQHGGAFSSVDISQMSPRGLDPCDEQILYHVSRRAEQVSPAIRLIINHGDEARTVLIKNTM